MGISCGNAAGNSVQKMWISNQPNVCIFDDPCLSKFGVLRGSCPHPGRQFVGLLCVSLAAPESPPIVSGVSDMHPSDCPNVEETRNPMQTFSRKKCTHFSPTNFHLYFHLKSHGVVFSYYYLSPKRSMLIAAIPFLSAKKNTRKRASSWKHRQKRV